MAPPDTISELTLLVRAVAYAARQHRAQRRKGARADPYINHPIEVARILCEEGGVTDVNILCSALLHDTVEDTDATIEELSRRFGQTIASIVQEVSDDKVLPKEARKRLQIEHSSSMSVAAKLVKLGDKTANVRDVTHCPPLDWTQERRSAYLSWASDVVAGLRGVSSRLELVFDEAVAAAHDAL